MRSRRGPILVRWALGLAWSCLAWSCSSTSEPPSGDPSRDLAHRDPRVRVLATHQAVESGRKDLIGPLIERLSDRDGAVRLFASIALRKLTGEDFGFEPAAPVALRAEAIARWRDWARKAGHVDDPDPASPSSTEDRAGVAAGPPSLSGARPHD